MRWGHDGGEIYVKVPSMKVTELAETVTPEAKQKVVGIPLVKLHEQILVGVEDAFHTYECPRHY